MEYMRGMCVPIVKHGMFLRRYTGKQEPFTDNCIYSILARAEMSKCKCFVSIYFCEFGIPNRRMEITIIIQSKRRNRYPQNACVERYTNFSLGEDILQTI